MKTHIIFRCTRFKKDDALAGAEEMEKTILLEEDGSAFRNGSYVLSSAAVQEMSALDEQYDNVIPQEINGQTYSLPETLFGREYKPKTLSQIREIVKG
jgi:hypothetical protein